jgi:hypothetical protein
VPLDNSVVTYTGLSTFGATTVVDEWKLGPIPIDVMDSQFNAWPDTGNYIARVAPLGTITVVIVPEYIGIGQSATITVTSDTAAPVGGILVDLEYESDLDAGRYDVPLSLLITAGNVSASGTIYTYGVEVTISVVPISMDYGDSALVTVAYVAGRAPVGGLTVGLGTVDGVTPDCYYYLPGECYIAPGASSGSVLLETFVSPRMYVTGVSCGSSVGVVGVAVQSNIGVSGVNSAASVSGVDLEYLYINILTQPVSASVLAPDAATFMCEAETNYGTGLHYQWKKNGVNVGTNSATYNTGATTWTGTDDVIACVVSNGVASVTSDNATLNVRKVVPVTLPVFFDDLWFQMATSGFTIGDYSYVFFVDGNKVYRFAKGNPETGAWEHLTSPISTSGSNNNRLSCPCEVGNYIYYKSDLDTGAHLLFRVNKNTLEWETLATLYLPSNARTSGLCFNETTGKIALLYVRQYADAGLVNAYTSTAQYNIATNSWEDVINIESTGYVLPATVAENVFFTNRALVWKNNGYTFITKNKHIHYSYPSFTKTTTTERTRQSTDSAFPMVLYNGEYYYEDMGNVYKTVMQSQSVFVGTLNRTYNAANVVFIRNGSMYFIFSNQFNGWIEKLSM